MKNEIINFLIRYSISRQLIYFLIKIKSFPHRQRVTVECNKRKNMGLFEYEKLSKNIETTFFHPNEMQHYGFNHVLCKYIGVSRIKSHITNEHGFIFSEYVADYHHDNDVVLTFSDYREVQLKKRYSDRLSVIKIGPYIHYADSLLSPEEKIDIKKELGKTLLVFPFHSIDGVLSSFDTDEFIERIEKYRLKNNVQSVIVCLYWKDIQIGRTQCYISKGYKITTAGHINDIYFLNRLRSIIELADLVFSNELGTYIGYCLYLNKNICLMNQKNDLVIEKGNEDHKNSKGLLEIEGHWSEYNRLQDLLITKLSSETISSQDLEFLKSFFGLQYVKNATELKSIL